MVTPSDEVYCYHFNATGSTVAMTDSSQTMVNKYAYDPFGKVTNQEEAIPRPFKFVGQYGVMTEPNGFYYMRARYYDPNVGRFISEDPIGLEGGDVNLYAYVGNNPVVLIDPDGLKGGILIPIRKAIKDAFRGNKWVEFLGDTVGVRSTFNPLLLIDGEFFIQVYGNAEFFGFSSSSFWICSLTFPRTYPTFSISYARFR